MGVLRDKGGSPTVPEYPVIFLLLSLENGNLKKMPSNRTLCKPKTSSCHSNQCVFVIFQLENRDWMTATVR